MALIQASATADIITIDSIDCMHPTISLPDTAMTTTGASIYTNPTALFGVEGQVAVITGGGTGKDFYTLLLL